MFINNVNNDYPAILLLSFGRVPCLICCIIYVPVNTASEHLISVLELVNCFPRFLLDDQFVSVYQGLRETTDGYFTYRVTFLVIKIPAFRQHKSPPKAVQSSSYQLSSILKLNLSNCFSIL